MLSRSQAASGDGGRIVKGISEAVCSRSDEFECEIIVAVGIHEIDSGMLSAIAWLSPRLLRHDLLEAATACRTSGLVALQLAQGATVPPS
jgi:hypothetical protein